MRRGRQRLISPAACRIDAATLIEVERRILVFLGFGA